MPIAIGEVSSTVRTEGEPVAASGGAPSAEPGPALLAAFRLAAAAADGARTRLAATDEDDR